MATVETSRISPPETSLPGAKVNAAKKFTFREILTAPQKQARRVGPGSTYGILSSLNRLRSGVVSLTGVMDPSIAGLENSDDMDAGSDDFESDPDDADEDDRDDSSIQSWHSDDQSIHAGEESSAENAGIDVAVMTLENPNNNAQDKRGADSSQHTGFGSRGQLPVVRSSGSSKPTTCSTAEATQGSKVAQMTPVSPRAKSPQAAASPAGGNSTEVSSSRPAAEKEPQDTSKIVGIAVPKPVAEKSSQAATKPNELTPPKVAADAGAQVPLTQIVRVRKPDGTIVRVRRPIKPGQIPAQAKSEVDKTKSGAGPARSNEPRDQVSSPQIEVVPFKTAVSTKNPTEPDEFRKGSNPKVIIHETEKAEESSRDALKLPNIKAQNLGRRTSKVAQIIIWTIMILFPLLFIILGVITAVVSGQPADSSTGTGITQAIKISVSLWPIMFAAILAQVLRMYASYKAERGLRLMTLEQLMGSHSVSGAIKQPFLLQKLNWISLALLCLWSLSPLAGQALLRMSYVDFDGSVHNVTLQYVNTTAQPVAFSGLSVAAALAPELDALLGASILAPMTTQQGPIDTWGNPKIPILEKLNTTDASGWSIVKNSPSYSSLIGVPVGGLTTTGGNTSFGIQSAYFTFDCPALTQVTLEQFNTTVSAQNLTIQSSTSAILHMSINPLSDNQPGTVYFAAYRPEINDAYAYTACSFTRSFVESHIFCAGDQCAVDRTRRTADLSATPLGILDYGNWILYFSLSGASRSSGTFPDTLFYINEPASAGTNNLVHNPDLLNVSASDFTARLSLLLNSYWQAGVAPYDMTGKLDTGPTAVELLSTPAVATSTALVYHTSWAWLAVLLVSSVVLLVGGVAGAIWDSRTIGPDIFGFASSLAHRNKYMRVPTGDGTMGGPNRARMLGHTKVMLQDVRPDAEVGRIALGTVDNGGERLRYGRLYK